MELETGKLSSSSLNLYNSNKFCISVDGSKFSDFGFELIFNEFFSKGDKMVVVHISNTEKLPNIPFNFQPDTIFSKYQTKLLGKLLNTDYMLIVQPKENNSFHALKQVLNINTQKNCNVLVMGFQGHKSEENKKEITKGTIFMIENVHIPTFIIKDKSPRISKSSGGYNWLVGIEDTNSRSFKAFQYCLNFFDSKKDKITIVHIYSKNESNGQVLFEKEILKFCQLKNLKTNFEIKFLENNESSIGKQLNDFINFGEDCFDFIVIGHNAGKYKNLEFSPIIEICKYAEANILYFCDEDPKKCTRFISY